MTRATTTTAASEAQAIIAPLRKFVETGVALHTLLPFPGNPKDHDLGAIMESIQANGVADVIRAQLSTRHILGGHGTVEALRHLGVHTADVLWLDCDEPTAARLVLAYNRASELGGFHLPRLVDFLSGAALANNLRGTGYDAEDVDSFRTLLNGNGGGGEERTSDREADVGQVITVHVARPRHVPAATKALQRLLARHPEWSATLVGR